MGLQQEHQWSEDNPPKQKLRYKAAMDAYGVGGEIELNGTLNRMEKPLL